jgi:HSP20 family protein
MDMFGYAISDFERTFGAVDELRQRLGRAFGDTNGHALTTDASWPRTSVYETKDALVLLVEVPGLTDKDLDVTLKEEVLTLSGERKLAVPEGAQVHRQELRPARFSRSFALPFPVVADRLAAELKDGVLTVTLPKVPEEQPRRVPIKMS